MDDITKVADEKMKKSVESLKKTFASVRTGRASPSLLDHIIVEYYGTNVPLKQLANVAVPESRQLLIQPYDKNSVKDIEKAIQKSDLGLNPNTAGTVIRLVMPPMTEENRKNLVKIVSQKAELARISIRTIRESARDAVAAEERPRPSAKTRRKSRTW